MIDEHDNPFEGIIVEIRGKSAGFIPYVFTDENGIARFDNLTAGQYEIFSSNMWRGSPLVSDAPMIEHCMDNVSISANDTVRISLYYPVEPFDTVVQAVSTSEVNSDLDSIDVYFSDFDSTLSLDKSGKGILTHISLADNLTPAVSVTKNEMTGTAECYLSTDSNGWPYYSVLMSYFPVVEILTPQTETKFPYSRILLTGTGNDYEDGDLVDDAVYWQSDLDGDLGTGFEISPILSIGRHTIILTGKDSSGKESTDSIIVNISHYSDESYFPLPREGIWVYRHEPSELTVTNARGETELWTLQDMSVTSDDINTRICIIYWDVVRDGVTAGCKYTLTDHLVLDGDSFLVTQTDEVLSVFENNDLSEELAVTTVYTPSYPLLTDHSNPQANNGVTASVSAESALEYTLIGVGTRNVSEAETITVSYETAPPEEVAIGTGSVSAINVNSKYGNTERTWWLSKGIGIVRMEYELSGQMLEASLIETNMSDFAGQEGSSKISTGIHSADTLHIPIETDDDIERMRTLCDMMKSMCPR